MNKFTEKCSLLSSRQYGFVSGSGTQQLLEDVADEIYSAFEGNMFSCAAFLDVSKAFDTVNHKLLLKKLWKFGFRGPFYSLLANLLDRRSQVVSKQSKQCIAVFTSRCSTGIAAVSFAF